MKKSIFRILCLLLLLYFLQMIVAPELFPKYYPSSNESTGILFGSIALFTFIGMRTVSSRLRYWLLCDLPYFLMIVLFSHGGAYGIGLVGLELDGIIPTYHRKAAIYLVLLLALLTLLIQTGIWVIVKVLERVTGKKRERP